MRQSYRTLGIVWLIVTVAVLFFTNIDYIIIILGYVIDPEKTASILLPALMGSVYESVLLLGNIIIQNLLWLWMVVISITLIVRNAYTKQLLYFIYGYVALEVLNFILNLPVGKFLYVNLLIAIVLYYFAIRQDNMFSRGVKGSI